MRPVLLWPRMFAWFSGKQVFSFAVFRCILALQFSPSFLWLTLLIWINLREIREETFLPPWYFE
jgi:hypothetical protein